MEELTAELRKVNRTLEERIAFLHRLSLAKEVYVSLFTREMQPVARQDWENMFLLNKVSEGAIFTHQLAEMLEDDCSNVFYTFKQHREKLIKVAEYIVSGDKELESNLPEAITTAARERVAKVISKHILDM